jgi:hypothetical protein
MTQNTEMNCSTVLIGEEKVQICGITTKSAGCSKKLLEKKQNKPDFTEQELNKIALYN